MKRHLSVLACLALVVVMVFALASCNLFDKPEDQPEHTHSFVDGKCECGESDPNYVAPECEHAYSSEVTKEANCTEAGEKKFTCTLCGESYTQEIAANGHTEEVIPGTPATCTGTGLLDGKKCTVCGVVTVEQFEIAAAGHSYEAGKCTVCGENDPDYNGPKTYVFETNTVVIKDADGNVVSTDKAEVPAGSTYVDGYFTITGIVTQRIKEGAVYCVEVGKQDQGGIQFTVSGTATVEILFHSTSSSNTSWIGLRDADGNLIDNNEKVNTVTGTGAGLLVTYTLDAGTYTVCSPALLDDTGADPYNRTARVYSIKVTDTPVVKNEIKVETTDTYSWIDEYTFTADAEGYYTFNLPAGLGFAIKDKFDNNGAPEIDFYENENGYAAVIGLEAGETLAFYVGALTKDTWTIEWTFEAGEVENGGEVPGPSVDIDTELELGTNSIYAPSGAFGTALECTFVVTEAGTYTFSSNYLMAVITIDELTTARGQAYLEPGTYVVNIVYYASSEGYYDIEIEFEAPATGEADGSEQFPFVWETLPESVTFVSDNSNMVYYVFTATADGSVTFTWAVEGNDWFNYFELVNGATSENNGSGYAKTSHTFVVEAGKTYRVGLGTWNEGGETVVNIAFAACAHVWSEATCTAPSTCANCGATTGDKAEHTSTVAEPTCANPDVCAVCNEVIGYIDHTMDDGVVITPADCATGTEGSIKYTCTVCGHEEIETLYAYHEWDYSQCVEATCTTAGKYHTVCTVCGEIESYDIEATGHHNYFATCGETTNCMECGAEFTVEHEGDPATCTDPMFCYNCWSSVGEPLGHDYDHITHDATCTAAGYVEHICALCDDTYTDGETEALGHADENGDYKCDRCSTKMLPEDGTTLTVAQAIAVANVAGSSYSTQKYFITGIVTNVYNTTYGNLYLKDAEGNQLCIYGLYTWDKAIRYDKMEYKPVEGDELTVYTVLGTYNSTAQGKDAWMDDVVAHEHDYKSVVTDPTCVAEGFTTHTCSICKASYTDSKVEALGHTTDNGVCGNCGLTIGGDAPVIGEIVRFDFGSNGSAAHVDGNDYGTSKSFTSGSHTLALTGMSKVFGPAYDAKGNSCIKLGTSKVVGSFSFTVGEDVTEVVIYVAGYKAATSTNVKVNGTQYTVKTTSDSGTYTAITIDTTTTKTITFTSVTYRCMIDAIVFNGVVA